MVQLCIIQISYDPYLLCYISNSLVINVSDLKQLLEGGGRVSVDAAVVQDTSFLKPYFLVYPCDLKNAHFK